MREHNTNYILNSKKKNYDLWKSVKAPHSFLIGKTNICSDF